MKLITAMTCAAAAAAALAAAPPPYKSGELLVKFRPAARLSAAAQQRATVRARFGADLRAKMQMTGVELWRLDTQADMAAVARAVAADPAVLYAAPNHYLRLVRIPDDTRFDEQWGLHNTGQSGGTSDKDIDAPEAWEISTGSDIIVAVIDTGVNYSHPDLAANMWRNPGEIPDDGIDNDGNGYIDDIYGIDEADGDCDPMDDDGHGSHCAGIIGAVGNNTLGVAGVNWRVRIMALDFFDSRGWGEEANAIKCIEYAIRHGARVISASWGGDPYNPALYDTIEMAGTSNILFVAGAGNDGKNNDVTPFYPSSYSNENIIAVAASDRNDAMAYFSCFGSNSVDLAAPGMEILSTVLFDQYGYKQGTSMATPFVTGAAALLLSIKPELSFAAVKKALLDNVDPVPAFASKLLSGGRLNVYKAALAILPAVEFDRPSMFVGEDTLVTLYEPALQGALTASVQLVSSAGDSETLLLYERSAGGFIFTNLILIGLGPAVIENGILEGGDGTALYALHPDTLHGGTVTGRAAISLALHITITTTPFYVAQQQQNFAAAGYNNGTVPVDMIVSNAMTGQHVPFHATNAWSAPPVTLTPGTNTLIVSGTNAFGFADAAQLTLVLCGPSGATNYAALSGAHTWPFLSPATAATSIPAAVDAAYHGNLVLVGAGTYAVSNLQIDKAAHLRGEAGAAQTILDAGNAARCLTLTANAIMDGFTLRNGVSSNGGGAYLTAGMLVNVIALSNRAAANGGGFWLGKGARLSNCTARANTANRGAGLHLDYGATATHCAASHNFAYDRGGGAYLWYGMLAHSLAHDNFATNRAGGVYVAGGSEAAYCIVSNNTARQMGGGIYARVCLVNGCIISHNTVDQQGGGVYAERGAEINNSLIYANLSKSFGGGVYGKFGAVNNCTIVSNRAVNFGGGVFADPISIRNSIIYYNAAAFSTNFHATSFDGAANCVTPAIAGGGTMTNPPAFRAFEQFDLRLRMSSPCINAGSNVFAAGATDFAGQPRIVNGRVDIGAYEFALGAVECVFDATPSLGGAPLDVSFSAQVWSTNLAGFVCAWDFDNDGAIDTNGSALINVVHTYTNEGVYSVALYAMTPDGATGSYVRVNAIDVVPEPAGLPLLLALCALTRRITRSDRSVRSVQSC